MLVAAVTVVFETHRMPKGSNISNPALTMKTERSMRQSLLKKKACSLWEKISTYRRDRLKKKESEPSSLLPPCSTVVFRKNKKRTLVAKKQDDILKIPD